MITGLLLLAGLGASAQEGVKEVLESVERNNKSLQASRKLTDASQLEARTGNYLANPSVELEKMWGEGKDAGSEYSLTVKQSVDFPSAYGRKSRLAELKTAALDYQWATVRQQVLLAARQKCVEVVYLRKAGKLLAERLENARAMRDVYGRRLETGDANQMEWNKVELERLNAENEWRLNEAALEAAMEELRNLNGGVEVVFPDEDFGERRLLPPFEELCADYEAADPGLKSLTGEQQVAEQEVKVGRALSLPKFDVGYKRSGSSEGEASNGFVVGVSVPLFENKNTVKRAKAQAEFATVTLEENRLNLRTQLRQLYQQAEALSRSLAAYERALEEQRSIELLNKALDAGQISVVDYYVEVGTIYDSWQSYLEVERAYHDALAQLYRYRL